MKINLYINTDLPHCCCHYLHDFQVQINIWLKNPAWICSKNSHPLSIPILFSSASWNWSGFTKMSAIFLTIAFLFYEFSRLLCHLLTTLSLSSCEKQIAFLQCPLLSTQIVTDHIPLYSLGILLRVSNFWSTDSILSKSRWKEI